MLRKCFEYESHSIRHLWMMEGVRDKDMKKLAFEEDVDNAIDYWERNIEPNEKTQPVFNTTSQGKSSKI